jgi:hypothetical protein
MEYYVYSAFSGDAMAKSIALEDSERTMLMNLPRDKE